MHWTNTQLKLLWQRIAWLIPCDFEWGNRFNAWQQCGAKVEPYLEDPSFWSIAILVRFLPKIPAYNLSNISSIVEKLSTILALLYTQSKVVKIGIRIVRFYDPTIPHIEKEPDWGRIAHPNRIGRIDRIVRSYDPTPIQLNMLFGLIYIIGWWEVHEPNR